MSLETRKDNRFFRPTPAKVRGISWVDPVKKVCCQFCGDEIERLQYSSGKYEHMGRYKLRQLCSPSCRNKRNRVNALLDGLGSGQRGLAEPTHPIHASVAFGVPLWEPSVPVVTL